MKLFSLLLQDAEKSQSIDGLSSFIGEDKSGSFGILAGHTRMMSSLVFGLARFRIGDQAWQYLALPGALLYFNDNKLSISTERYMISDDYKQLSTLLQQQLSSELSKQQVAKKSLHQLEQELFKRLWESGREGQTHL